MDISTKKQTDKTGHAGKADWYVQAFNRQNYFDQYSTELSDERTAKEVDFIERAATLSKEYKILDVACGHGRHVNELARRGYDVWGVDIAPHAIEIAQKAADELNIHPHLSVGDMKKLPYKNEEFDRVYNVFTSFGYFDKAEDEHAMLVEIHRVLKSGGIFLIDVLSLESEQKKFEALGKPDPDAPGWIIIPTKIQILSGEERKLTQWFDPETHMLHTRRDWMEKGEPAMHESFLHLFGRQELEGMLKKAGLEPTLTVGNYDGTPHNTDNSRTIITAEKKS